MEQGLKIKIGAETVEVRKSLDDLQNQLKRFQNSLKTASDPRSIERLNKAILRTNQYIGGVKTAGLQNIPGQANNATTSLTNLGRIASDLPFGFVAISNNLDPLFQSFGQLRKETGSAKEAFKQLGSSLLGGGGIALAFSVITAAITYFSMESSKATRKAKELKEEMKSVGDLRDEAAASVQGEVASIAALTAAVLDENKARSERLNAINELKKVNKAYFGDLSLEATQLDKLKGKVEEYTNAIIQQAVVKKFSDQIADVTVKLSQEEKALDKVSKKYLKYDKLAKASLSSAPSATNFSGSGFPKIGTIRAAGDSEDELNAQVGIVSDLRIQQKELTEGINEATSKLLKFKSLSTEGGGGTGTGKDIDILKTKIETLEGLKNQIGLIKSEELQLLDLKIQLELRDQTKNKLTGDQLRRLIDKIVFDADLEAKPITAPISFQPKVGTIQGSGFEGIDRMAEVLTTKGQEAGKVVQDLTDTERLQSYANALYENLTPAFQGLFDTMISGGQSALQAVGQFLTQIIKKLAAAAIQAAVFAGIMTAFGLGGGASFGSLFKGNFMGGLGIKGSASPGNMAGRGLANSAPQERLVTSISGNQLNLVLQRTNNSNNRLG